MAHSTQVILFFEDVLPKTGWGLYYKFMLAIASCANFIQATTLLCIYFGASSSYLEANFDTNPVSIIYAVFNIGRALGGFVLNKFGDLFGRKRLICCTLVVNFVASFIAGFGYSWYMVVFAGFFIGASLECNMTVIPIHLAEILPLNKRAFYLMFCNIFWTFGYLFFLICSMLLVLTRERLADNKLLEVKLSSWRMLFALSGGLSLMLACATALLEESTRWFLYMKKTYLAGLTLKQFYALNTSSYGETFGVKDQELVDLIDDYGIGNVGNNTKGLAILEKSCMSMLDSIKILFQKPFLKTILLLITVKTPLLFTGIIEINILLAKTLNPFTAQNDTEIICIGNIRDEMLCHNYFYINLFVIAINILIGQIATMFLLKYLGRRLVLTMSLIITGLLLISMYFAEGSMMKLFISTQIISAFSAAFSTVTIINIEAFPTALRATSFGVVNLPGLISSCFLNKIYTNLADVFFIVIGTLCLCASIPAGFLPDLRLQPMIE